MDSKKMVKKKKWVKPEMIYISQIKDTGAGSGSATDGVTESTLS